MRRGGGKLGRKGGVEEERKRGGEVEKRMGGREMRWREGAEATFKCGQKSQIVRCRTCSKRRIVRQSAAKIVKLCGQIVANIH